MATSSARSRDAFGMSRQSSASSNSGGQSTGTGPTLLTTAVSNHKTLLPQAGDVLSIEVQARNPRRRFPLSDEFLPKVQITPAQTELLRRQCIIEMNRVVRKSDAAWTHSEHMFDGHSGDWRAHFTSKPHQFTLYRRKRESNTASLRHFTARGQIASCSLKDLEYGLYCDTTTQERAVKTDLYKDLFLDAAVLHVMERQEDDDAFHFFGIKWLAYVSPADKFVSSRDYAVVEYARTVVSSTGDKMLVKVVLPVDTACVSVLAEREYDLVRGEMACTYLYRYDQHARAVQVFAEGWLDPRGSATSWLGKAFLTQFAPTIVNLDNCADVKHFVKHGRVLSPEAFQARLLESKKTEAHKQCTACLKKFSTGLTARKKIHASCRCCGQVMCSRCVVEFTLCLPWHEKRNAEHPSAVMDEKFCLKCVCLVRAHRNDATSPLQTTAAAETPVVQTPSQRSYMEMPRPKPVTLLSRTEQLNFEDAPLPSQHELDEAHYASHARAATKWTGGVDRLRQLKERHLAKDKHRNLGERARVPSASPRGHDEIESEAAEAFGRMEKSIAEQELLLRNIQLEAVRRETQQRDAYAQFQIQQQQLQQQQQKDWRNRSSTHSSVQWKHASGGLRMTDASLASSSAFTAVSSDYYDLDDDVYVIAEDNGGFDLPSPPRFARTASREHAAFV